MQGKLHVPQLKHHLRIWLELVLITKTAAFFFLQIAPMLAVLPVCNIKEHLCLFEHSIWQFETKTAFTAVFVSNWPHQLQIPLKTRAYREAFTGTSSTPASQQAVSEVRGKHCPGK